jgi:OPA family glycerol-3-phosphate transporter-like MFS transporter
LQWRIVILGWITYAAYYLGRVNLSTALPAIEAEFGWSADQIGLLAGASIWTYALGQLVNGWIGQRANARRLVFLGIIGSTVFNLLFAVAETLPLMVFLSLGNGFMQSMGWGPILRTLSDVLMPQQRQRIAGAFGTSYIIGTIFTWIVTGLLLGSGHWRLTFIVPPLLMLGIGVIWYVVSPPTSVTPEVSLSLNSTAAALIFRQFWYIVVSAIVAGALFAGALAYAPAYAARTLPLDQAALAAIILPLSGLAGAVWLGSWMLRRFHGNTLQSLAALLLLAATARGLAFALPASTLASVVLLASMGATGYALTNTVLTAVPLTAQGGLPTSMIAGLMDAFHSIGGAAGSTLVGLLLAYGDWSLVFGMWTLMPLLALAVLAAAIRYRSASRLKTV